MTYVYGPKAIYQTEAVSHNDIKPRNKMNGCANNGPRSKRYEMTLEGSKAKPSPCNGSALENVSRSPGGPLSTTICGQEPAKPDKSTATTKKRRKKKKHCYKKRNIGLAPFGNCVPSPTEDWEGEIQEVKITHLGEMSFGTRPYGPEDVVNFCLRNLSLEQSHPPLWQVTCHNYLPAKHHQPPLEWSRYKPCSEPGQFSDVED
ncbi:uncharacterized protein [Eucyclogobius newberryi]|uniref:uncharacterized protein n=1 Tax=Eucyclogobius newberryi TaxID=166745 RepID=UPI003B5CFD0F